MVLNCCILLSNIVLFPCILCSYNVVSFYVENFIGWPEWRSTCESGLFHWEVWLSILTVLMISLLPQGFHSFYAAKWKIQQQGTKKYWNLIYDGHMQESVVHNEGNFTQEVVIFFSSNVYPQTSCPESCLSNLRMYP